MKNGSKLAVAVAAAALGAMSPGVAQEGTWSRKIITPETALKAAQAALAECRKNGWQVAVTVGDPAGLPLVTLRDRYAGWHTLDASAGKARTAASWRDSTSSVLTRVLRPDAPERSIANLPGVVMVGGGLVMEAGGSIVGVIGVSGAPGGEADDACGKAGIDAIKAELEF